MRKMPRKWIEGRAPSHEVRCQRYDEFLEGYCAAPVQLVVTRSPLSNERWHELVVERCLAGHIARVTGVEPDFDVFHEDADLGDGNQADGV
jgi:hypothetical protein